MGSFLLIERSRPREKQQGRFNTWLLSLAGADVAHRDCLWKTVHRATRKLTEPNTVDRRRAGKAHRGRSRMALSLVGREGHSLVYGTRAR